MGPRLRTTSVPYMLLVLEGYRILTASLKLGLPLPCIASAYKVVVIPLL